jgi:hypothetical protein
MERIAASHLIGFAMGSMIDLLRIPVRRSFIPNSFCQSRNSLASDYCSLIGPGRKRSHTEIQNARQAVAAAESNDDGSLQSSAGRTATERSPVKHRTHKDRSIGWKRRRRAVGCARV